MVQNHLNQGNKLKQRLKEEGFEPVTNCHQLKPLTFPFSHLAVSAIILKSINQT